MARKRFDWVNFWAGVIVFAVVAIIVGGSIYIRAAAPCKYIDWMPVKEVPARCLTVGPQR